MRKFLMVALLGAFVLGGCNTLQGLGDDLKEGGQKLDKAVNKK